MRWVVALLVVAVCATGSAQGEAPPKADRRCISALSAAGVHVAGAAAARLTECVRRAATAGASGDLRVTRCLAADRGGLVAAAQRRTAARAAKFCKSTPAFGPALGSVVGRVLAQMLDVTAMLGTDLDAGIIAARNDGVGAACQVALVAGTARLATATLAAFSSCLVSGLRAGTIGSVADVERCHGADPGGRVARMMAKLEASAARRCARTSIDVALPGECARVPLAGVAACLRQRVDCDCCRAINTTQRTAIACQKYVDGVARPYCGTRPETRQSVARQWDEEILEAIRHDTPRPTVHARNLFHLSAAMYDAWAAYQSTAVPFLTSATPASFDVDGDRAAAVSFAAYRVLRERYKISANAATSLAAFDARMLALGYDPGFTATDGDAPAAVGNRIAAAMLAYGRGDGANEEGNYADPTYQPVNVPLIVKQPGTVMVDPNRWQPLALDFSVTQNGLVEPSKTQVYIGARWNAVRPFALTRATESDLYLDPGPPPRLGGVGDADAKVHAEEVIRFSSYMDPDDGATIDISPGAFGNNPLGTYDGTGHPVNPVSGEPYPPNVVKRGDFARVLAEFWADGPASETPPGHWNVLANTVSDTPGFEKRFGGAGPVVGDLEWDVKLYFALNGAVHDAAIVAWGVKRRYDGVRPISLVRYMGCCGQSFDPSGQSYNPDLLPLVPGLVETITAITTAAGERHAHLSGHEGEIAIYAWPGQPADPATQVSGAKWIRAVDWVPYQKKTFVTPAFPGYISGHSTFSRAAAEVLARVTGSPFFPGGLGSFVAPKDTYLTFEHGPTQDVRLEWGTYYDAADQAGLSRLCGGIHVRDDDLTGRRLGSQVGIGAYERAQAYFAGVAP